MKLDGLVKGILLEWRFDMGVMNMFIIEDVYRSIFLEYRFVLECVKK